MADLGQFRVKIADLAPKTLKPRWLIEQEEALDNQWREAGVYKFVCDHCSEYVEVSLPALRFNRAWLPCPACHRKNMC